MEPLIAVYSATGKAAKGKQPVVKSGWRWIKNVKDAVDVCKKALGADERLSSVHICEWRTAPSHYTVVYGTDTAVPAMDMAANLRATHLKKKGEPKPRVRYKPHIDTANLEKTTTFPERFILLKAASA